ncbi:olfactory receptor 10A4-like [Hyla sarda]|uniref:olfactory receptor 10A4-like n=1 Tax=Hyla sarda TaxID=327740 RepID=UPI0024C4295E|nr:olfactory receptor 10A4-like [Hyla sarda]
MKNSNSTIVTEFILLAFKDFPQFSQILLFIACFFIYITCIVGNIIIFLLIHFDFNLNAPMYYFISRFSILEIVFVSIIVPKLLDILIAGRNRISFEACFLQLYCADTTGIVECYLLTVMVFDRHFAITSPFQYEIIMTQWYIKLAIFPWLVGLGGAFIPTIFTASLKFCGPNVIDHFFCDLAPLQNLACSDPYVSNLVTSITAIFVVLLPFIVIIGFYTHIIVTVLKIKSVEGKRKAFSTCSSHLIVASLYFCTGIIVYVQPSDSQHDKFLAFIYTIVTPLLNPFIYTFRNREVKLAFAKLLINVKSLIKNKMKKSI